MPLRDEDDKPTKRIDSAYAGSTFGLKNAEEKGTANTDKSSGSTGSGSDIDDGLKNDEEKPSGSWKDGVKGNSEPTGSMNSIKGLLKQKGPLGFIVSIILFLTFGLPMVFSPGLLLVHVKETIVDSLRVATSDTRTVKILASKFTSQATSGVCSTVVTLRCKYSTMTTKQVNKFAAAGIEIEYDTNNKTMLGRVKPKKLTFNGITIDASDFKKELTSNMEFRSAVRNAYNPRWLNFAGSAWKKVALKLKISKSKKTPSAGVELDDNGKPKMSSATKKIREEAAKSASDVKAGKLDPDATNDDGKPKYTSEEQASIKNTNKTASTIADNIKEISGATATNSSFGVLKKGANTLGSAVKFTGPADTACNAYNTLNTLSFAAKTLRAAQLASYAMLFLNVADQIKAGEANPEDVSLLGDILTHETVYEEGDTKTVKTATDSVGYKYAAYGEIGEMTDTATMYLAAGGFVGTLSNITGFIDKMFNTLTVKGSPRAFCKTLNNKILAGGSIVLGIAALFTGVGLLKAAGQLALEIAKESAMAAIPYLLQDIVAGAVISETTIGEEAGNALVSGSGAIMSNLAASGGNLPLTPKQAVAYNHYQEKVIADNQELDRLEASPFDVSNSSTFMGNAYSQLLPYLSKTASIANTLRSIISLPTNTLSSIFSPLSLADDSENQFKTCTDIQYLDPNGDGDDKDRVATDMFCNVIYGMDPDDLEVDSLDNLDYMLDNNHINDQGDALSDTYKKYLKNCLNRQYPLGDPGSGEGDDADGGSMCIMSDDNKTIKSEDLSQFAIFSMDSDITDSMGDNESAATNTTTSSFNDGYESTDQEYSFYDNSLPIDEYTETLVVDAVEAIDTPQEQSYLPANICYQPISTNNIYSLSGLRLIGIS